MRDGPAVQLDGLSRSFGDVDAVRDLSLEVPQGIIFGFLGPNGAGKTTTIGMLLGLVEPTAGRADVLGLDPWRQGDQVREQTGAVLEDTGVYDMLTVEDNLEFYARAWRLPPEVRRERIRELLGAMGLWERRRDKAGTWSRGMRQRLALARALVHRPPLVFLDEPTAGLDVIAATEVREDLGALAGRDGTTIFLTTHNMAEAERLCALVAVIRNGRLLAMGSPAELRARGGVPRVEVTGRGFGEPVLAMLRDRPEIAGVTRTDGHLTLELREPVAPAPLIALLVRAGVEVDEVQRGEASLEDVFLTLMEEER